MRKSLFALAALGSIAGTASAQSSVTMFGVVDANILTVKNAERTYSMGTDGLQGSRLGLRGVEDLGDGLKAGFWLEMGLQPNTGRNAIVWGNGTTATNSNALFFNRRSTVSLSNPVGRVAPGPRLHRHLLELDGVRSVRPHQCRRVDQPGAGCAELQVALAGSTYGTLVRANNMVQYILPNGTFGPGFYGQLQAAAGEGAQGNKYYGGRIGYAAGPFNVAAAYGNTELDVAGNVES